MLIPSKRTAIDGRTTNNHRYSTDIRLGRYRTKRACQIAIDYISK